MHAPVLASFLSEIFSNPNQWEAEWMNECLWLVMLFSSLGSSAFPQEISTNLSPSQTGYG